MHKMIYEKKNPAKHERNSCQAGKKFLYWQEKNPAPWQEMAQNLRVSISTMFCWSSNILFFYMNNIIILQLILFKGEMCSLRERCVA